MNSVPMSFGDAIQLKAELLAEGVRLNGIAEAKNLPEFQPQIKAIYDDDATPFISGQNSRIPEVIELALAERVGGSDRVFVKIRVNQHSPWKLDITEESAALRRDDWSTLVGIAGKPPFYGLCVESRGKFVPVETVVQKLGPDLVATMVSNYCTYFSMGDTASGGQGCRYCELISTYRDNRPFPMITKPLGTIVESLRIAVQHDRNIQHILVNSGNSGFDKRSNRLRPDYDGVARSYAELLRRLRRRLPREVHLWAILNPPEDVEIIDELVTSGGGPANVSLLFDIDVFDEEKARSLTPGKFYDYGREAYWRAMERANSVRSVPRSAIIYGLQSYHSERGGPRSDEEELKPFLKAVRGLIDRHAIPLISIYHSSPQSRTGPIQLNGQRLLAAHMAYAEAVHRSGLLPSDAWSVFASRVSLPNNMEGDAYSLYKLSIS